LHHARMLALSLAIRARQTGSGADASTEGPETRATGLNLVKFSRISGEADLRVGDARDRVTTGPKTALAGIGARA